MKLAAGVVAILVAPLIVIVIDPGHESLRTVLALFSLTGLAIIFGIATIALGPWLERDVLVDERRAHRFTTAAVLFIAGVIATAALVFGTNLPLLGLAISTIAVVWSLIWIPRGMRRLSVQTESLIERDPRAVFDFLIDFRNLLKYAPDVTSVEKATDGDIRPGTRFLCRFQLDSVHLWEAEDEIVDMSAGQWFSDRIANGTRPNLGVMSFQPTGASTLLAYRFESEVSYPQALLGRGLLRGELMRRMRRRRTERWERLKQLLESRPDA